MDLLPSAKVSLALLDRELFICLKFGSVADQLIDSLISGAWDIQVPEGLCSEGQKLLVEDLRPSDSGGFYRIYGAVQVLQ